MDRMMDIFLLSRMYKCVLWLKAGDIVKDNIILAESQTKCFLKASDFILNALQSVNLKSFSKLGQ